MSYAGAETLTVIPFQQGTAGSPAVQEDDVPGGGQCNQGAGMGEDVERDQGLPFRLGMQRRAPGSAQGAA